MPHSKATFSPYLLAQIEKGEDKTHAVKYAAHASGFSKDDFGDFCPFTLYDDLRKMSAAQKAAMKAGKSKARGKRDRAANARSQIGVKKAAKKKAAEEKKKGKAPQGNPKGRKGTGSLYWGKFSEFRKGSASDQEAHDKVKAWFKNNPQSDFIRSDSDEEWEDDEAVEFIKQYIKDHPKLYFRFEEGSLGEESFEMSENNEKGDLLNEAYDELGKEEFEKEYPYRKNPDGNFVANGVNAIQGELLDEPWMTEFLYTDLYAFEGINKGENIAADGDVIEPTKIIQTFNFEEMGIEMNDYGQLFQPDKWENKAEIIRSVKKQKETESSGKGRGWFGDSDRHAKARETGHADFDLPYDLQGVYLYQEALQSSLSDFSELPTSIRVAMAVDENLPILANTNSDLTEAELLMMAYDIARREDETTSDFIVDDIGGLGARFNELKANFATRNLNPTTSGIKPLRPRFGRALGSAGPEFFRMVMPLAQASIGGKVTSSNVAAIGYDNGRLQVAFENGSAYEYDVDPETYQAMAGSGSKGEFIWDTLRGKAPGRVIDNPNKMTPGGVGGSIVPYMKTAGQRISTQSMEKSIREVYTKLHKGGAKITRVGVGTHPIQKKLDTLFNQKTLKAAQKSVAKGVKVVEKKATKAKTAQQRAKAKANLKKSKEAAKKAEQSKKKLEKLATKTGKKPSKEEKEEVREEVAVDNTQLRQRILLLRKQLGTLRKLDLDAFIIDAVETQINSLKAQLKNDFIDIADYKVISDFAQVVSDSRYFKGPITRAGEFDYGADGVKIKDFTNLKEAFSHISHLPAFDSHNENKIVGFAYNFTSDDTTEQIFSEGYTFEDIDVISSVDKDTKRPVSIRYIDTGTGDYQNVEKLIHLAISLNNTEVDRCSSLGGAPCYVSFDDTQNTQSDFEVLDMADKKKDPPSDSEEEMDSEEEDDKASKDKKKDDKSDFIEVRRSDWDEMQTAQVASNKILSDMGKTLEVLQKREEAREAEDMQRKADDIRKSYKGDNRVSSDMIEKATLAELQVIQKAIPPLQKEESDMAGEIDTWGSIADMKKAADDFSSKQDAQRKKWGVSL